MTVVLDTNVVVAALVARGLCHEACSRAIRLRVLASSGPLLEELESTLRSKFGLTPAATEFLKMLRNQVRLVEPEPLPRSVCRDPDDDVVLATAVAAAADLIVTGDDDLLVLRQYQGVAIVSPRQFLEQIDGLERR